MRKYIRKIFSNHNFLSLSGNASAAILGFISFALLARMLSKPDFGNLMIFITLGTFFDLLRTGFLQTPLIKFASGTDDRERKEVIGTSWVFGLMITAGIAVFSLLIYFVFGHLIKNDGYLQFLKWVWILSCATLPFNFAAWILQCELKFNRIIFIRWISLGSFVLLLVLNLYLHKGVQYVIYSFISANILASVVCLVMGWTKVGYLRYASRFRMKELSNFGKFSMSTMIGSNLLRSSDTFMIGALMGPAAVAIYSVPAKLFEIIEIPLRSFVATALPNLSRLINAKDENGLKHFFERSTGLITMMLIPVVIICFVFAEQMVLLLGGDQYLESANILRIFAVFALLMPLDRYSGVTLDVLNKPVRNFQKIVLMLTVKIGGNFLVIYTIGEVWSVVVASIFTFSTGVLFGIYFLKKYLNFSVRKIILKGYSESKLFAMKGFSKINTGSN